MGLDHGRKTSAGFINVQQPLGAIQRKLAGIDTTRLDVEHFQQTLICECIISLDIDTIDNRVFLNFNAQNGAIKLDINVFEQFGLIELIERNINGTLAHQIAGL